MFGVMETQSCFVVETALSDLGTVGKGRLQRARKTEGRPRELPCLGTEGVLLAG